MNKKYLIGGIIIIGLAFAIGGYAAFQNANLYIKVDEAEEKLGSVQQAGEYHATSTGVGISLSTDTELISDSSAVLGSVIILASSSAGTLTFKNASSTTDTASTTSVVIPTSLPEGTYTFDMIFTRGLVIEPTGNLDGNFIITYR